MERPSETRTLSEYLRVLSERRRLIFVVILVAAGTAFAVSAIREPVYEGTATVDFQDPAQQTSEVIGGAASNFFPQNAATAGAEIVTRNDVVAAVAKALDDQFTPDSLRSDVNAEVQTTSTLVTITAKADSGETASLLANEFARQVQIVTRNAARKFFKDRADTLPKDPTSAAVAKRLETLAAVAEPVEIVRLSEVPDSPSSPKPLRDTIIAGFLGLLVGIGAAFVRESLDRRVTDAHEIQRDLGIPLVGYVRSETLGMVGLSANGTTDISEDDLEAFRILRTNVDFLAGDEPLKTVAVTSALPEEGKSTVAAWYAYANAVAGRRTVLVECDLRRPVLADRLGFLPAPGLDDYLSGNAEPADILRQVSVEGATAEQLPVIPAGVNVFRPAELLGSQRFKDFLAQISRAYELVVIDSAPLLPVGDALELIPQVDGVLLCVRLGQTTVQQANSAKEAMQHLPDRPIGLVVTGLERGSVDDYYGYYSAYDAAGSAVLK